MQAIALRHGGPLFPAALVSSAASTKEAAAVGLERHLVYTAAGVEMGDEAETVAMARPL